jgi:catechol 2,3-dioxygenase-like lactoylglutathione lyase family enzyme
VGIKVHDLDEAVSIYREVMGSRVSDRYDPGDNPHSSHGISFMRCGDLHHELSIIVKPDGPKSPPEEGGMHTSSAGLHHIAFQVASRADFDAWESYIRSLGIEIAHGPVVHSPTHPEGDGTLGENRAFYFHDPSGNGIEIFTDIAPMNADTNRVEEDWFRARLERDGFPPGAADPPPVWAPGVSSMKGAHENFGKKTP